MNLRTLLDSMRRYWRTCAAVGVSVAVIGLVAVLLMPTRYQSTVRLMVTISGATTATAYQNDDVVASRVNSYIALLTSEVVSQRVVDRLGLQADAADLAGRVSAARVPPNTSLIDVAVTADSPVEARLLADTVAQEFITYTRALETPTGQDDQKVRVSAVAAASEPRGDLTVRTLLALLVVLAAVLLAAVAAWVRAVTDPWSAPRNAPRSRPPPRCWATWSRAGLRARRTWTDTGDSGCDCGHCPPMSVG